MQAPSFRVATTAMSLSCSGAVAVGSASRITRSARLPAARLPLLSSSRICQAASIVSARRAAYALTRSDSPNTTPVRLRRVMAVSVMRIGSICVTEKSLWLEQCSPKAMALAIGLMRPAR